MVLRRFCVCPSAGLSQTRKIIATIMLFPGRCLVPLISYLVVASCFSNEVRRFKHGKRTDALLHFNATLPRYHDPSAFLHHASCMYAHSDDLKNQNFPSLGTQFELEVQALHRNSNVTYRSTTTSDIVNSRGAVTMEFDNKKEVMLYDLKGGRMFRLTDKSCTEEALQRTSCNPLAYFLLNNTDLAAHCRFDATTPVEIDSGSKSFRGSKVHKWKQCLRLKQEKENFVFLMTYSFHEAAYTKYTPIRLDVDLLYPGPTLPQPYTNHGSVVFNFLSFVPRISNRSVFQVREPIDCPGWNAIDISKTKSDQS